MSGKRCVGTSPALHLPHRIGSVDRAAPAGYCCCKTRTRRPEFGDHDGRSKVTETLQAPDIGTAPAGLAERPSSVSHGASRRRTDHDPGQLRLRRTSDRAGGHDDPRHLRSAQAEDRQPADDAELRHPQPQGPRGRRPDVHEFGISARHGARQVRRSGLLHLRREGQDQSEAREVHAHARQGRASLRSRRDLCVYLDRGGGLRRQHPGHLRHPRPVEPDRGRALVAAWPERRGR